MTGVEKRGIGGAASTGQGVGVRAAAHDRASRVKLVHKQTGSIQHPEASSVSMTLVLAAVATATGAAGSLDAGDIWDAAAVSVAGCAGTSLCKQLGSICAGLVQRTRRRQALQHPDTLQQTGAKVGDSHRVFERINDRAIRARSGVPNRPCC